MGNCLKLSRVDSQHDYSLLHGHQEHGGHHHMGNIQQGSVSGVGPSSGAVNSASSFSGASPRDSRDFPNFSSDGNSNYTISSDRGVPVDDSQMKLAQRYGLIQHLPTGLYDGAKKDRECPICMVELNCGDPVRFLPCMHVYHKDCIDDWLLKHSLTCPNCMEPVDSALLNSYEVGKTPWNYDSG
ncbi:uncharacterized protein LOC129581628 isoform X2 [Paramacrobiotus metropolitanus]|nr:uncharacterized protein LOC129581628 isoform X2 [Paramacrobiotus metropolitanus]XP_055328798.1 uncharacterized protein LOC129581628 isoform X2 [Paramacrobiotus metropolitanus]